MASRLSLHNLRERVLYWSTVGVSCLPPNRYRSIFVLGYPRTGTNWLCSMLSRYFEIPISEPWLRKTPAMHPVILHLHRFVVVPRRTIYMIRDPRDIVISHYHKILADPDSPLRSIVTRFCEAPLVHENLQANLAGYVRFLFDSSQLASMPIDLHLRKAREMGLYTARYEDMLARGEETLTKIVEYLSETTADAQRVRDTLEATSFEKHTGRKRGEEDVNAVVARKGIAGDWVNSFTPEAARVFDELAGDLLIETGYETDHTWVEHVGESA
jgi:hypothetical protein